MLAGWLAVRLELVGNNVAQFGKWCGIVVVEQAKKAAAAEAGGLRESIEHCMVDKAIWVLGRVSWDSQAVVIGAGCLTPACT